MILKFIGIRVKFSRKDIDSLDHHAVVLTKSINRELK